MRDQIEYVYFSSQGKVRPTNQDNFYCPNGCHLPENNAGMERIQKDSEGRHAVFCVFDGMGGEKGGELAAYLAASEMKSAFDGSRSLGKSLSRRLFPENWLRQYVYHVNDIIDQRRKSLRYNAMGTTMAAVMIAGNKVIACNVGDSRIYRLSGGMLEQVSVDHVQESCLYRSRPLIQYLGIPKEEMIIMPHICTFDYKKGDRYLLCTDGVWSYGKDNIIEQSLTVQEDPVHVLEDLFAMVDSHNGRDNATAILLTL